MLFITMLFMLALPFKCVAQSTGWGSLVALTDQELARLHTTQQPYNQPTWERRDLSSTHVILQRAAVLHQQGDLSAAVEEYKTVIRKDPGNGEAYASLSKCLNDQGKHELADKAMAKATRLRHDANSQWTLF